MGSRTRGAVLVYSLLIVTSLWAEVASQILNTQGASAFNSPVFQSQSQSALLPVSTKGFNSAQRLGGLSYYNNHPINAAYWTGGQFARGYYPQPYYPQYQMYNPYQSQFYPQPYGLAHHSTGFAQSYGHYPNFDASYWMTAPPRGYAFNPYYNRSPMYYPGQYYPGAQFLHGGRYMHTYPGQYPYYKKPFGAGLLSGTNGHFVKGLVGGLVVASIAKKIG